MISFRLSHEEYEQFAQLCSERGVARVSDMARTALQNLIAAEQQSNPLSVEVRDLRSQLHAMSSVLDRICNLVENSSSTKE
jgi:hypothetical protein